jgi:putative transcription antitermination factor YqgF
MTAINEIMKMAIENRVDKVVLGLPLTYDGKDTPKARKVRNFGKKLKIFLKKPLIYMDETESTKEAIAGRKLNAQRGFKIDHISAGIILKRFFDQN